MKPVEKAILSIHEAWDNDIGICQTQRYAWAYIAGYLKNETLTGEDIYYILEWIYKQIDLGNIEP